ncbi:MAG: hypothetical protein WBK28_03705 [Minisyncoccia bacterium]
MNLVISLVCVAVFHLAALTIPPEINTVYANPTPTLLSTLPAALYAAALTIGLLMLSRHERCFTRLPWFIVVALAAMTVTGISLFYSTYGWTFGVLVSVCAVVWLTSPVRRGSMLPRAVPFWQKRILPYVIVPSYRFGRYLAVETVAFGQYCGAQTNAFGRLCVYHTLGGALWCFACARRTRANAEAWTRLFCGCANHGTALKLVQVARRKDRIGAYRVLYALWQDPAVSQETRTLFDELVYRPTLQKAA